MQKHWYLVTELYNLDVCGNFSAKFKPLPKEEKKQNRIYTYQGINFGLQKLGESQEIMQKNFPNVGKLGKMIYYSQGLM